MAEQKQFLDAPGLTHLWAQLKTKFAGKTHDHDAMTGASDSAAGAAGMVPAPAAGANASFLRGDGTWAAPEKGVFIATYGETTLEEIGAAEIAGKLLCCNFSAMMLPIASGIRGIFYNFYGGTDEDGYMATIQSDGTWSYVKYGGYEPKTHTHEAADISDLSDTKPARYIIGTSTSGWTETDCDYLCDGTADDVEIQAALDALTSGGEVVLLDGTYKINATINMSNANLTLRGNGPATKLLRWTARTYLVNLSGGYGVVENMTIDGRDNTEGDKGIYALSSNNVVRGCVIQNFYSDGIHFAAGKNKAIGNTVTGCGTGIYLDDDMNIASGNIVLSNRMHGINVCDSDNIVTGNISRLNGTNGVNGSANLYLFYADHNTITGNNFAVEDGDATSPTYAIHLYGTSNTDNIVVDNQTGIGRIDIQGGTGNEVGSGGRMLLWENASRGSAFAAQTILTDTHSLSGIEVIYFDATDAECFSSGFIPKGDSTILHSVSECSSGATTWYLHTRRVAFDYDGSVTCNDAIEINGMGYSSPAVDNGHCIPYKIYGYKGAIE